MWEETKAALKIILKPRTADFVLYRESWIIVEEQGKAPRLEKSRYFSFVDRKNSWPSDHVDVTCMTREAEEAVREYISRELGLKRFSPGADDPTSLLEVWA